MGAPGITKKKTFRKGPQTYASYIHKVLKQVAPELGINSKAILHINFIVEEIVGRLALQSASVAVVGKKSTLGAKHVQSAVKTVFPRELAKHAVSEATRAVAKFAA